MADFPENIFTHCPKCGQNKFQKFGKSKLECLDCGFVFYINMGCGAAVFIFNQNGEILLGKRQNNPKKGLFGLPGGMVDFDETAEQAAIREAWEEVNLRVSDLKYLTSQTNYYEYKEVVYHLLDMYFIAKAEDLTTLKAADETDELVWIKPELIDDEMLAFDSLKKALEVLRTGLK